MTRGKSNPRSYIVGGLLALAIAGVIAWVANNTYWEEVDTRGQLQGEALTNPFYGAQRLAKLLGASTEMRHDTLRMPPPQGLIVLGKWNWSLMDTSRERLERWVSSGGRLVVSRTLLDDSDFDSWVGITQFRSRGKLAKRYTPCKPNTPCDVLELTSADRTIQTRGDPHFEVCDLTEWSYLKTTRKVSWRLNDHNGNAQVMRVPVGLGSVTVVNTAPFHYEHLLCKDDGRLFVTATELRPGDRVEFLTEGESESLLLLIWDYGWPAIVLAALAIALWLWRTSVRFGPLEEVPTRARRSLAEQIRGTGQFTLRFGGGKALYRATVRAFDEAAVRRVPGYERLSAAERVATLAPLTGIEAGELSAAFDNARLDKPARGHLELRKAIAVLEIARRQLSIKTN